MKIFYLHLCYNMAPNPTYTGAPANRETFVFAQLCLETTGIDLEKATIINLYDNSDNIQPLAISFDQFMAYFYPDGRSFSINCDASGTRVSNVPMTQTFGGGDFMRLDAWVRASRLQSDAGAGGVAGADASGVQFELVPEVLEKWANDLGVAKDCWTPCSLMNITSELLAANYVCNFACDVCCSVSTFELAQALNSQANQGSLNPGAQYDGRDASRPVKKGDCLALSLLFTNPNVGVRPIDVRLNFCLSSSSASASAAAAAALAGGPAPLHRWIFDETSGTNVADTGTTPVALTLTGSSAAFLGAGGGVALPNNSGQNSYVEMGDFAFAAVNGFTFTAWVKFDSFQSNCMVLFLESADGYNRILLGNSGTTRIAMVNIYRDAAGSGGSSYSNFTTPDCNTANRAGDPCYFFPVAGSWAHIALTIPPNGGGPYGGALSLYRDGALQARGGGTRYVNENSVTYTRAALGRYEGPGVPAAGGYFFDGELRDARLYDRQLTNEQITEIYDAGKPSGAI